MTNDVSEIIKDCAARNWHIKILPHSVTITVSDPEGIQRDRNYVWSSYHNVLGCLIAAYGCAYEYETKLGEYLNKEPNND